MDVSVDDRRALWALTTRHLRSRTYGAVLLARCALRARAGRIDINTRGDTLRVVDDGAARADELTAILEVLRAPTVEALHALEARFSTDLLVALATAQEATIRTGRTRAHVVGGRLHDVVEVRASTTEVSITRPRSLRREERTELAAWLPAPRAVVRVDGRAWRRAERLPDSAFFTRAFKTESGHGLIGFSLDDGTSKTTVLGRGLWVAQDATRPRGLPIVAIWDDDDVVATDSAVARARVAVQRAGNALQQRLADEFADLPRRRQRQLRSLLLRGGVLPPAFHGVPLFGSVVGGFRWSLQDLAARPRIVIGSNNADVVVDAEARAYLHRALPTQVKDALPAPRRRLAFAVRSWLGFPDRA